MNTTITINVVETNGTFDDAATEVSFRAQYSALKAERLTSTEGIAGAVNAVFDRSDPGERINLPHVVSMAIADLKVSPKEYGKWEVRVLEYVRSNSKGPDSIFEIGKGSKNGGVARRVQPAVVVEAVGPSKSEPAELDAAAE